MELEDLVRPEGVIAHLKVTSKKQALQELSERAAKLTGLSERAIFETLLERERLGSTGVGQGIAIPHGKLGDIDRLYGLFARLDTPIDFESVDDQPVALAETVGDQPLIAYRALGGDAPRSHLVVGVDHQRRGLAGLFYTSPSPRV